MKGIRAQNVNFTFFLWGSLPFVNNVWNTIFVIHGCSTWIRQYFCSSSVHWYITQTINQKAMHIVRRIIIWLSPMQQYQIWTCDITMLKMHFYFNQIFQKTICNMVVEVPRWTNAKMEVSLFLFCFYVQLEFPHWPEEFLLFPLVCQSLLIRT